jgi:N utilization substance protein A
MLDEAKKIKPDVKPGDELEFPLEFHEDYGRIAAQTAKQVIIQRIREAEREAVFDEYKSKEGELISGLVQRIEGRNIFLDIGRTAGILLPEEQIPGERYRVGERIKALIVLVEKNPKGPGIFLSRSHPRLLRKLFELEVPEIASGAVEIKAVAREAGSRSKIAVFSKEPGIDPVGSLVGQKGVRVTTVIQELGGEKIDIIEWSEDQARFIASSLSPAKVLDVEISPDTREAKVIVPDDQLSLAIGKGGQNVRLAAKLTGWKIDVRSDKSVPVETDIAPEPEKPEENTEKKPKEDSDKKEKDKKGSKETESQKRKTKKKKAETAE